MYEMDQYVICATGMELNRFVDASEHKRACDSDESHQNPKRWVAPSNK